MKGTLKHEGGYRVLVYGGRDYASRVQPFPFTEPGMEARRRQKIRERAFVFRCLDRVEQERGIVCIITGCADGADDAGLEWGERHGKPLAKFPVTRGEWKTLGKVAGILRNGRMLEEGQPDVAVQMPGGRGTADMRRRLDEKGVPVWEPVAKLAAAFEACSSGLLRSQ